MHRKLCTRLDSRSRAVTTQRTRESVEETCLGLVYWQRIFSPGKVAAFAFFFSSRWLPRQRVRARVCVCVCVCERERETETERERLNTSWQAPH